MKHLHFPALLCAASVATMLLGGCATVDSSLANGQNLRAIMTAQIDDESASARHGTTAPQGTDPEVAAAAVKSLRERGSGGTPRAGLFDILLGGKGGN